MPGHTYQISDWDRLELVTCLQYGNVSADDVRVIFPGPFSGGVVLFPEQFIKRRIVSVPKKPEKARKLFRARPKMESD